RLEDPMNQGFVPSSAAAGTKLDDCAATMKRLRIAGSRLCGLSVSARDIVMGCIRERAYVVGAKRVSPALEWMPDDLTSKLSSFSGIVTTLIPFFDTLDKGHKVHLNRWRDGHYDPRVVHSD